MKRGSSVIKMHSHDHPYNVSHGVMSLFNSVSSVSSYMP